MATTLPALARFVEDGVLPPSVDRFLATDEDEESEYAALMAAAEASAALIDGPGRRVVVVAEADDPDAELPLRRVVAVHADATDAAAADEDLLWYAGQEIPFLLDDD